MPFVVLVLIALAAGSLIAVREPPLSDARRHVAGRDGRVRGRARGRSRDGAPSVAPAARARSARSGDRDGARAHARARSGHRRRAHHRRAGVPRPQQRQARRHGSLGRPVGRRQRDVVVDRGASARDRARRNAVRRRGGDRPRASSSTGASRTAGCRCSSSTVVARRDHRREHDQGDPRPRPPGVQPDRRDARAVVPERSLGSGRGVLRRRPRSILARRRSPRTRALLAGGAVAIAVGVACSRVLLGVHWMSDVMAGLALGWAWFAVCAIAFGGRFLVLGAPVEKAAEVAEQNVPAAERPKTSAGQTS